MSPSRQTRSQQRSSKTAREQSDTVGLKSMNGAAGNRSESLDGNLEQGMRRNNGSENSAGNRHENNAGVGDEVLGDRSNRGLVQDQRFRLQADSNRPGNSTQAMEDTFGDARVKQEESETGLVRGGAEGGGSASSSGSDENSGNDNSKASGAGGQRTSSSGMASLDEMDVNTIGEIPDLSGDNSTKNNSNTSSSNFDNEHGGRHTDINDRNNDKNNDEMVDEEDDGEEEDEDGDGDGEEDEGDEDEEDEIGDDYEDDLEDDLDEPSGAFANVAQGLVGKYKNYMMQYWQNTIDSIERDEHDFKNHQLPLARIKKVMKTDEEVKMISAEAPILFAKGCDIFITELTMRAWIHAEENKRRTLQKSDIAAALQKSDMFDFLIDIVPREEERPKRKSQGNLMAPVVNQPMQADPNVQMPVPMSDEQLYSQYQPQGFFQPQQQYQEGAGGGLPEDVQDPLDPGAPQDDSRYYQQQQQQQQQFQYQ